MVYSNRYNDSIEFSSYKTKSKTNFQKSDQNFEKGGIIYNDYIPGIKKIGTSNYNIRSNFTLNNSKTPYTRLTASNLSDDNIKENIQLSSCNNERLKVINIKSNLNTEPNNIEFQNKLERANEDLNECVDIFMESYKHPDKNITKIPSSNILPNNYPVKDEEIFGPNLDSCVDSQMYHDPYEITLPQKKTTKPVYGTNRAYDNNIIGPRVFDIDNINKQTVFNTNSSGYNIQGQQSDYNFKIVEDFTRENYEEGDKIKSKNYCENNKCSSTEYNYKNNMEVYKGKCGTKSTFGTISDKLDQKPHLSEFVKNNIIGANFDNMNHTSMYGKNKATFNNKQLESSNLHLNDIRKNSFSNFISNTNKLRDEFNNDYFKQKTYRMKNNLEYRG